MKAILFHLIISFIFFRPLIIATGVNKYSIELDESLVAIEHRWDKVATDYASKILNVKKYLTEHYDIPNIIIEKIENISKRLDKYIPENYYLELKGIANVVHLPLSDLFLANIIYDITAFCTSIIVENTSGQIIHGRNLDYKLGDVLRDLVVEIEFLKSGKPFYTATTFAGYVGILTGQKPGVFTLTLNQRDHGSVIQNLVDLSLNFSIASFAIRDIMALPDVSYAQALELLSHRINLIAPCYLILAGTKTGEGAVITRDPESAENIRKLDLEDGVWYLVETNYDSWTSPPPDDDRRNPAEKMLDKMSRDMDLGKLGVILDTRPVCNSETLYTVLMSAGQPNVYSTVVKNNDCSSTI